MCGFAGFLRASGRGLEARRGVVEAMADTLRHRGPDDGGAWVDADAGIALAHRRLAVVDLTPAGHQPMSSASGRYVIVFNGEIYNHLDLRTELEAVSGAVSWRGHSDTETLLAAIDAWGVQRTLEKAVGMFAFALWDRASRALVLARDRLGEKPLYYGRVGDALVFASELKAIRAYPGFDRPVDRDALALYLRHNYIPAPWSVYQGIRKLRPGTWLCFRSRDGQLDDEPETRVYWSARAVAEAGLRDPFRGDETEAEAELARRLDRAIAGQMIADVPLGAFLSGGIDSSAVVALMQARSSQPARTFTIGFHETGYNEAEHAAAVARHLGTAHTELYVTSEQARAVIPELADIHDEPFADSSQIPTVLVSRLARGEVTVSLSGDGGDELFGGYNRYFWAMRLWRRLRRIPMPMRRLGAGVIDTVPPVFWERAHALARSVLPGRLRHAAVADKLRKLSGMLEAGAPENLYTGFVSHWEQPESLVLGAREPATLVTDPAAWLDCPDFEQRMMYLDTVSYLPDDILVKVDRAAMSASLETRVPMLDHRVVEFAWSLPLSLKIRNGEGKWLLRQLLYRHVPRALLDRPKMGFGVPIDAWLRGPLRDWAESLLDEARLRREGYFDPAPIRQKWREHLSGRRAWHYHLWDVLMFQAWLERWKP